MFGKSKLDDENSAELEIWVAWCAGGDHVTGKTEEDVRQNAVDDLLGPMINCAKMTLTVPLPQVTEIEAKVEPEDAMALVFVTTK